jgi:hypothetical protein
MTGKNLTAYYIDSNGNRVSIPTYRWDINPNWVIFQAPATTRIYLTVTNTPLSIFNTPSNWFPPDSSLSEPYYVVTITFPSPWSQTNPHAVSPFTRQEEITRMFDGANILVIYTVKYAATPKTYIYSRGVNFGIGGIDASYTATIVVQAANNVPSAYVYANPQGYHIGQCIFPPEIYHDIWFSDYDYFLNTVYELSLTYQSGSGSGSYISTSVTIYARVVASYRYWNPLNNWCSSDVYVVSLTITPSADVSYSSFRVYSQVNRVITAATGARIYVVGSLDSLPTA